MKRFLLIAALAIFSVISSYAQFSVGFTNTANLISFKLKPSVTTTTGFSTIEFFVRYPTSSPAFTYGTVTANTTDFPGMTATGTLGSGSWEIERNNPAYLIPGYNVDHLFYTGPAPATTPATYNANQEYNLISIPLIGNGTVNMEVVHQDTEANFYLAITSEVGSDLRPASFTNYFYPTTSQTPGPNSSTIYYSSISPVLPIKFLNFDVNKIDNTALISWSVENEDGNADKYIIEKSANGIDFVSTGIVVAQFNGTGSNTYTFTQDNLSAIKNSGVIYFRIKQVDKDGKFVYTPIKNVRLDGKTFAVNAYPNPVKSFTKLTIDLAEESRVLIAITDAGGKQVKSIQIQGFKGTNIQNVNLNNLASGNYMMKVQAGNEVKSLSLVKVN